MTRAPDQVIPEMAEIGAELARDGHPWARLWGQPNWFIRDLCEETLFAGMVWLSDWETDFLLSLLDWQDERRYSMSQLRCLWYAALNSRRRRRPTLCCCMEGSR